MTNSQNDLDPSVVLELLPTKIAGTRRVIQELKLDISVLTAVAEVPPDQIGNLRKSLRMHEAILKEYEKRQTALRKAAEGKLAMATYNDPDYTFGDPFILFEGEVHCYKILIPCNGNVRARNNEDDEERYCSAPYGIHSPSGWGNSIVRNLAMPVSTGFRYPTDIGTSGLTPNVVCYVSDDVRSIITHLINNACACQGSPPQDGWVHDPPWTNAVHAVMYDQEGGAAGGGNIVGEVVYLHVNNPQENETWNADEIAGGLYIGTVPNNPIDHENCCYDGNHSHVECKGGVRSASLPECFDPVDAADDLFEFCTKPPGKPLTQPIAFHVFETGDTTFEVTWSLDGILIVNFPTGTTPTADTENFPFTSWSQSPPLGDDGFHDWWWTPVPAGTYDIFDLVDPNPVSTSYWAIQGCNTQYPIVQRSGHLLGQNGTSPLSVMPYASTNPNNLLIAELRGTGTMEDIAVDHILFPFLKPSDGYYGAQYGAAVGTIYWIPPYHGSPSWEWTWSGGGTGHYSVLEIRTKEYDID